MNDAHDSLTPLHRVRDQILRRQRFAITSHVQPDGDSLGSSLAMAYALQALDKQAHVVFRDPVPDHFRDFPGVSEIVLGDTIDPAWDAVIVMECGTLNRTGLTGLTDRFLINIDHHVGNTMYGAVNWFDESAAACAEMIHTLIDALDVPLSEPIATHLYLAILTDTGAFHHANITARTFEISRQVVEAGVDPARIARQVFNSSHIGKLKLTAALLSGMVLEADDRLAVLHLDDAMLAATGCSRTDTEGLINMPLMAGAVRAVVMFKTAADGPLRVSLRSKEQVDVRAIAHTYGGGGHLNAAGFTSNQAMEALRPVLIKRVAGAIDRAEAH